jgi:uncharacterized membrane protein
VVGSL